MGTRVPSCGEICKLYIWYFIQIVKTNLKIKVFMKGGTDDEIDENDAAISSDHFLSQNFFGVNLGKFQDIWVFLKAVLNFS